MTVIAVYEGDTDLPVVRKLLDDAGLALSTPIDAGGKDAIDDEWLRYNNAARGSPWFVLRDLDRDASCAPKLLAKRKWKPSRWMCFRIATRALEAWLLADYVAIGSFFHVAQKHVPLRPDDTNDPTRALVDLAQRSTRREIRQAMVPRRGAHVGPLYEATIIEFGTLHWNPARASERSPSLARARGALSKLASRWQAHAEGRA